MANHDTMTAPMGQTTRARAGVVLALASCGSVVAIATALTLMWFTASFGHGLLSAAMFGCVALSGASMAAGWWAIDLLSGR